MQILDPLNLARLRLIHIGKDSAVYRGVRQRDRRPLIVKILNPESPNEQAIYRYKKEYEITQKPASNYIIKSESFRRDRHRCLISFEDFGGESLEKLMASPGNWFGKKNEFWVPFLRLAIQISAAVADIHDRQIVHNNLDLSHIIFNPQTRQLKIVSFGSATVLESDPSTPETDEIAVSKLPDCYALGRICYRLLTGEIPPPLEPPTIPASHFFFDLPEPLSDAIARLLSQTRENRYVSAIAIQTNLEEILAEILQNFGIFSLKSGDDGQDFKKDEIVSKLKNTNNGLREFNFHYSKLVRFYRLGDYRSALEHAELARRYIDDCPTFIYLGDYQFYHSLTLAAQARTVSPKERNQLLSQIRENQKLMQSWADRAVANFQHRSLLVEAECDRLSGDLLRAENNYERAISKAAEIGSTQDEALAYELAAEFYRSRNLERIFRLYLKSARDTYEHLQLSAKVEELESRYSHILTANFRPSFSPSDAGDVGTPTPVNLGQVIKAYQTLSGEIVLATLLAKTMKIIIENTGAEIGYLLLSIPVRSETPADDGWKIEAMAEMDVDRVTVLRSIPLNTLADRQFPKPMIHEVASTRQPVILQDATCENRWTSDEYIRTHHPKSILCTPLIRKRQLMGILYLENNLIANAFTAERIEVLSLLSAQVAISLENAFLYKTLEQKVTERTAELSRTIEDLKATQHQLIEAEKMAALGGLVAGVAHEINTPVGTGLLTASFLAGETQKFAELCGTGALKRSALNAYLAVATESSQLILGNLRRAAKLVQSFQQVAVDQASLERRTFCLKAYLEEVLLSIGPTLKRTSHRISVEGDETIEVDSYPGALSQIVTNLVINSLTHAYSPSESGRLRLWVAAAAGDRFEIRYGDDGRGIPAEYLGQIFDPFFTTTRNRGGSGLGLHIVYNLVTQTLKGTIRCESREAAGTEFIINCPRNPP